MREVKVGDRIQTGDGVLRVMAIAEGHAMVRYRGAMPHVRTVKELAFERPVDAGLGLV